MIETAYKYKPSGQEVPKRKRVELRNELVDAFRSYLDTIDDSMLAEDFYESALGKIGDLEVKSELEIHTLLVAVDHEKINNAGYFFSALHNNSDLTEMTLNEFTLRLNGTGYRLSEGKTLLIKTAVGKHTGDESNGIIINYKGSLDLGWQSKSPIINYGDGEDMGLRSEGPIINYGSTRHVGRQSTGLIINFGECVNLGTASKGIVINYGDTDYCGFTAQHAINLGTYAMEIGHRTIDKPDAPMLKKYLEKLKSQLGETRPDDKVINELKTRNLEKEIKEIIAAEIKWKL